MMIPIALKAGWPLYAVVTLASPRPDPCPRAQTLTGRVSAERVSGRHVHAVEQDVYSATGQPSVTVCSAPKFAACAKRAAPDEASLRRIVESPYVQCSQVYRPLVTTVQNCLLGYRCVNKALAKVLEQRYLTRHQLTKAPSPCVSPAGYSMRSGVAARGIQEIS